VNWEKWVLVSVLGFSILMSIILIDKPRKPMTPGMAVANLVVNGALIVLVVLA
jgi:hypothetical protein